MVRASGAHARRAAALIAACTAALGLLGCLERAGPGRPGYSAELRDSRDKIPSLESDELLANQVDGDDGIELDQTALRTGFAAGEQVYFWDLGSTALRAASLEPLWTFRRRARGGTDEQVDHPDLIDSVPGDDNYSPLRARFIVYVTGTYGGERIPSLRALEDAIELGLIEEPAPADHFVHRPVALQTARLPTPDGGELAPEPVYYRGMVAHQFRLGGDDERVRPIPMGPLRTPNLYLLRRRNQSSPIDEAAMGSDLDGDGDQNDTNVVLSVAADDPLNSGLWTELQVTVSPSYAFGDSTQESDLFMREGGALEANPDIVIDFRSAETRRQLWLLEAGGE
jgi:hypothetical protein